MKVDKVQQNYNNQSNVSFSKKRSELAKAIIEALPDKKAIKTMEKLEWLKGEAGGIAITAIGTGLVAPWPIAYNPFVKPKEGATPEEIEELKKTKKYTAMRQPISAVLAILFQLSALKPIDIACDKLFNEENFLSKHLSLHVNQTRLNKKSYIERNIKKQMEANGEGAPSIFQVFTKGWKTYQENLKQYNDEFDNLVDNARNKQIEEVAADFLKTGKISVGKRALDNETLAKLVNKQIDDYIKDAEFLKMDNEKLSFYTDRGNTLISNEKKLKQLFDIDKISKMSEEELKNYLEDKISKMKNPKDAKLKELLEEILDRPESIRKNHIERTIQRIETIKKMLGDKPFSTDEYCRILGKRNSELDVTITNLKNIKIGNTAKATQNDIINAIKKMAKCCEYEEGNVLLDSIMHDTKTFATKPKELLEKAYRDITKQYRKLLEDTYKGRNQIIKIIIGVCVTLPITCSALNWVYPRFMDKFFPDLAGAKKASKEKANGKEVK